MKYNTQKIIQNQNKILFTELKIQFEVCGIIAAASFSNKCILRQFQRAHHHTTVGSYKKYSHTHTPLGKQTYVYTQARRDRQTTIEFLYALIERVTKVHCFTSQEQHSRNSTAQLSSVEFS